jgi:hypothetical protein
LLGGGLAVTDLCAALLDEEARPHGEMSHYSRDARHVVLPLWFSIQGGRRLSRRAVYLLDASIGTILTTLVPGAKTFAQPVFDGTKLFIATETQGLYAFNPN